jgi:hypothetical protein
MLERGNTAPMLKHIQDLVEQVMEKQFVRPQRPIFSTGGVQSVPRKEYQAYEKFMRT